MLQQQVPKMCPERWPRGTARGGHEALLAAAGGEGSSSSLTQDG